MSPPPFTFKTTWVSSALDEERQRSAGSQPRRHISDENFDTVIAASTSLSRGSSPPPCLDSSITSETGQTENRVGVASKSSRGSSELEGENIREEVQKDGGSALLPPPTSSSSPVPSTTTAVVGPSVDDATSSSNPPPAKNLKRIRSSRSDMSLSQLETSWLPPQWEQNRQFFKISSEAVRQSLPGEPEAEPSTSATVTENSLNEPMVETAHTDFHCGSASSSQLSDDEDFEDEDPSFVETSSTSYDAVSALSYRCAHENLELRTSRYRLPLKLPRPKNVQSFDCSNLPFNEDLAAVPLVYILDKLRSQGAELLRTISRSAIALPASSSSSIPHWVSVRAPSQDVPPEYAMAITSNETSRTLFLPVHGLILATNCRALFLLAKPPPMPNPETVCLAGEGWSGLDPGIATRNLPVVHIHLPSATAFKTLLPYFYSNSAPCLLSSLLPLHAQAQYSGVGILPGSLENLLSDTPNILAAKLSVLELETLMKSVNLVHSVWQTAIALGAGRDPLWKVLDFAWAILIGALTIKEGRAAS